MGMPGLPELLLIFSVVVLLFGAKKIPKLFGAFGEGIKNFKKGVNTDGDSDQENLDGDKSEHKKQALDEKQD